ncbi:hypothetical protein C8J57DRAFT_1109802, partial [Mycena rebaudengoi]
MELPTTLSLSPKDQRARLERLKDEISRRRSDIARFEATHRQTIELLEAKQLDSEKQQREWEAALDCIKYPVLTLPAELVSRIFIACLPAYPRPSPHTAPLLVVQICHHWREIALETSELWASLSILSQYPRKFLETWLGRAKGFPLSL